MTSKNPHLSVADTPGRLKFRGDFFLPARHKPVGPHPPRLAGPDTTCEPDHTPSMRLQFIVNPCRAQPEAVRESRSHFASAELACQPGAVLSAHLQPAGVEPTRRQFQCNVRLLRSHPAAITAAAVKRVQREWMPGKNCSEMARICARQRPKRAAKGSSMSFPSRLTPSVKLRRQSA